MGYSSNRCKKGSQAAKGANKALGAFKVSKKRSNLVADPGTEREDAQEPIPGADVNDLSDEEAVAAVHQLVQNRKFGELNKHLAPSEREGLLHNPPIWPELAPVYSPYVRSSGDYSQIRFNTKKYSVHRLTARCLLGKVPKRQDVSHVLVMNPVEVEGWVLGMGSNVNPKHLVFESNETNQHRRACAAVFKTLAQWKKDNPLQSAKEFEKHCKRSLYGCRHVLHQEHPCRSYSLGLTL
jgi:hypothetical protein